jgi:hypothetical protein
MNTKVSVVVLSAGLFGLGAQSYAATPSPPPAVAAIGQPSPSPQWSAIPNFDVPGVLRLAACKTDACDASCDVQWKTCTATHDQSYIDRVCRAQNANCEKRCANQCR